jgi:pinin
LESFIHLGLGLWQAEQKAQEESERLRQQEREQLAEKRKNDLTLRANLAAQADEKQLELLFLQWTEHHTHLCSFLRLVSFVLSEHGCRFSFINTESCLQKV